MLCYVYVYVYMYMYIIIIIIIIIINRKYRCFHSRIKILRILQISVLYREKYSHKPALPGTHF